MNTTADYLKVTSLAHLKRILKKERPEGDYCVQVGREFIMLLNGGGKTTRYITYENYKFRIHSFCDESICYLSGKQIMDESITLIGKAILNGCFWAELFDDEKEEDLA